MEKKVKPRLASTTSVYMLVDLDINICRFLHRRGITNVGQLSALSSEELLKIRNIGRKRLLNIQNALAFYEIVNTDNDFWRG